MALHNNHWGKFIRNTHVRELVKAGLATIGATGRIVQPSRDTPRWQIVTDYALTDTPDGTHGPLIGWNGGLVLGKGPTMAAQYRNEKAGYDAYIIRDWLQPKPVIQDALSKICT
jgi:hypothetical protein